MMHDPDNIPAPSPLLHAIEAVEHTLRALNEDFQRLNAGFAELNTGFASLESRGRDALTVLELIKAQLARARIVIKDAEDAEAAAAAAAAAKRPA